jgi:hypothetical protein
METRQVDEHQEIVCKAMVLGEAQDPRWGDRGHEL